jgi:hypothetical protein
MTRPRIAAIASAIMASTVAFLLVSRSGLIGTVAGAALIPFIYTLVSHWAKEAFERMGKWFQKRVGPETEESADATAAAEDAAGDAKDAAGDAAKDAADRPVAVRAPVALWSLGLVAVAALALSGYSLSVRGEGSHVIQQHVVEKTVVVTVIGEEQDPPPPTQSAQHSGSPGSTTATTGQEPTTTTEPQASSSTTTDASPPPSESEKDTPSSTAEDREQRTLIEPTTP